MGSEYFFRGPLGTLGFLYVFCVAESEFRGYQAETLFNYLLLTFFIKNVKNVIFSILKKYQAILCHFLNKNGPYQLFSLTHSFRQKNSKRLKKITFFQTSRIFFSKTTGRRGKFIRTIFA